MKAIIITEEIKTNNPKIIRGAVGTVQLFGVLPSIFHNGVNEIHNYRASKPEDVISDGFLDVIEPTLNTNQKKGNIMYDSTNNIFTYEVINLTSEEIESNKKSYTKSKYEFHKANGWNFYQDFRSDIVLEIEKENLTETKAFEIEAFLGEVFDKISNSGDWKTAQFLLSQKTTSDTVIDSYKTKALTFINDYILNNYDL